MDNRFSDDRSNLMYAYYNFEEAVLSGDETHVVRTIRKLDHAVQVIKSRLPSLKQIEEEEAQRIVDATIREATREAREEKPRRMRQAVSRGASYLLRRKWK